MMGSVSAETCWASHKYDIKFWYNVASCWIFFVNYTMMHGSTNIKIAVSLDGFWKDDTIVMFKVLYIGKKRVFLITNLWIFWFTQHFSRFLRVSGMLEDDNLLRTRERAERKKTDQFKIICHPSGYTKCSHNFHLKYATTKEMDIPKLPTMK